MLRYVLRPAAIHAIDVCIHGQRASLLHTRRISPETSWERGLEMLTQPITTERKDLFVP